MTQPTAPTEPTADTGEVFLGTGAYGDPAKPDLTRKEFEQTEHPEAGPSNPSSDPALVTTPGGTEPAEQAPAPADAPAAPADAPASPATP